MKEIFKQTIKAGVLFLILSIVLAGAISYSFKTKKAEKVYAGDGENVIGFAWTEHVGWISFNNTSGGGGINYGVNILNEGGVGKLSGYAWSENIGWISFNRANAGTPPTSDVGAPYGVLAFVNPADNKLKGWARAVVACDQNFDGDCVDAGESGAGPNSGGWDGWIALGDANTADGVNYGITLNPVTKEFTGFAWGSDSVGWVSFNCSNQGSCGQSNYKVSTTFAFNNPPTVSNQQIALADVDYCSNRATFSWTFNDDPGDTQSRYVIEAAYGAGAYSVLRDVASSAVSVTIPLSGGADSIKTIMGSGWYNQTLNWRVTVYDSQNAASAAAAGPSVVMANHEYPDVDFSTNPINIFAMQDVQFLDKSLCYQAGAPDVGVDCQGWSWNFTDAIPATSIDRNPITQFGSSGSKQTIFRATDSAGKQCTVTRSVNVGIPLPQQKEKGTQ